MYIPPQTAPGLGPPCTWTVRGYNFSHEMPNDLTCSRKNDPECSSARRGPTEQGRAGRARPFTAWFLNSFTTSILFFANLLAGSFTRESGFHALFLAGLEVKGVSLYLFNNVFLLHFALEPAQGVLEGFTLLKTNFRQTNTPPNQSGRTE